MCGIIAILRRRSARSAPSSSEILARLGAVDRALAGASTLNRLENTNQKTEGLGAVGVGAHKIRACHQLIEQFLISMAVDMLDADTLEIVLDFDATDSLIHGDQEGKFFHGYYDSYCFMPLYCFIGP